MARLDRMENGEPFDDYVDDATAGANDLDWFILDPHGCIGWFCTATGGRMPKAVRQSFRRMRILRERFLALPAVTTALPGSAPAFEEFAERGLFTFDCLSPPWNQKGYTRVAVPKTPLHEGTLPSDMRVMLASNGMWLRPLAESMFIRWDELL